MNIASTDTPASLTSRVLSLEPLLLIFVAVTVPGFSQTVSYNVTTITPSARPYAINDLGQVAGSLLSTQAFSYSGGMMTPLASLSTQSQAYAINVSGQIAGDYGTNLTWGGDFHAYTDVGGVMTPLATSPSDGVINSVAAGINNLGQVVGTAELAGGITKAFSYSAGAISLLPTLGGSFTTASAVNNSGEIVGGSQTGSGAMHPFLYNNGVMTDLLPNGPNTVWQDVADSTNSQALAINDAGQIVGQALTTAGGRHAFLWSNGVMTDLGTLGGSESYAYGINSEGDVIGFSQTSSGVLDPFIWSTTLFGDTQMRDLNTLLDPSYAGPSLTYALGINDAGQIVAEDTGQNAVLLSLDDSSTGAAPNVPDAVPTILLLPLSLASLLAARRRVTTV